MTKAFTKKVRQENAAETVPRSSGSISRRSRRATPHAIEGNHSMLRKIGSGQFQVSQPGDKYEREADRMAARVMHMSEAPVRTEAQGTSDGLTGWSNTRASSKLAPLGGEPLLKLTKEFFEPRFGQDLSQVRVHHKSWAPDAADALNARAYTTGQDIVFGPGEYAPHTYAGKELLAHELAHVVQQSRVSTPLSQHYSRRQIEIIQRQPPPTAELTEEEETDLPGTTQLTDAQRAALDAALLGGGVFTVGQTTGLQLMRWAADGFDVTIANGLSLSGASGPQQGSVGGGIYFGPAGEIGLWGSMAVGDIKRPGGGVEFSLSRSLTIVNDPSDLEGRARVIGIEGGLGITASVAILVTPGLTEFLGISGEFGLGAGIQFFNMIEETGVKEFLQAEPIGMGGE